MELISPSRKLIWRWSASTASCRRWRPQGSSGDLGLGAAIAGLELEGAS